MEQCGGKAATDYSTSRIDAYSIHTEMFWKQWAHVVRLILKRGFYDPFVFGFTDTLRSLEREKIFGIYVKMTGNCFHFLNGIFISQQHAQS